MSNKYEPIVTVYVPSSPSYQVWSPSYIEPLFAPCAPVLSSLPKKKPHGTRSIVKTHLKVTQKMKLAIAKKYAMEDKNDEIECRRLHPRVISTVSK